MFYYVLQGCVPVSHPTSSFLTCGHQQAPATRRLPRGLGAFFPPYLWFWLLSERFPQFCEDTVCVGGDLFSPLLRESFPLWALSFSLMSQPLFLFPFLYSFLFSRMSTIKAFLICYYTFVDCYVFIRMFPVLGLQSCSGSLSSSGWSGFSCV